MSFIQELKRRNVLRVGAAYIVTAWLVVQVAETLFPVYGLSDAAIRIVVNVLAVGLVPVLVLSWVFEWTPDGLKRDSDVEVGAPSSAAAAKRLDRIILVVLALALGYFAFDKFVLDPARDAEIAEAARQEGRSEAILDSYGDRSIAVLAFEDMSPNKDQEYLSDGIAEEILNLLAQIPELRVISRSSAFSFKGQNISIPEVAERLNVAHVLEGSVRKAGDRIRITAQLIDARSDTHVWSETYDRTLDDIFAIQDELAAAMVERLELALLGKNLHVQPVDSEAYDLYLRGKHFINVGQMPEATAVLEQAVNIEPEFVDAWADLATAYVFSAPTMGSQDHTGDPVFPKLVTAMNRLRVLEPEHPLMLTYPAWETIETHGDYSSGAALLSRGVELYPNHEEVLRSAAYIASIFRKHDLAVELAMRLVKVNPICGRCARQLFQASVSAGQFDKALQAIERQVQLQPDRAGMLNHGIANLLAGNREVAAEMFAAHPSETWRAYGAGLVALYNPPGKVPGSHEISVDLLGQLGPFSAAHILALAGDREGAFQSLEQGIKRVANWQAGTQLNSVFLRSLHDDPRWIILLESIGLAPHQVDGIEFDPDLPWQR